MRVRTNGYSYYEGVLLLLSVLVGAAGTYLLAYLLVRAAFWILSGAYY